MAIKKKTMEREKIREQLAYAVEDGRLDIEEAEWLLNNPTEAKKWLEEYNIPYDPY